MRILKPLTRRQFGILLGAALSAAVPTRGRSHGRPHGHAVRIRSFRFMPADLTIRPGDTVTWGNGDTAPHTATARDGTWDTGELAKGQTAEITFDTPGRHTYICAFHPAMRGTIVVEP